MRRRAQRLAVLVVGARLLLDVTPGPVLAAAAAVAVAGTLLVLAAGVALNGGWSR